MTWINSHLRSQVMSYGRAIEFDRPERNPSLPILVALKILSTRRLSRRLAVASLVVAIASADRTRRNLVMLVLLLPTDLQQCRSLSDLCDCLRNCRQHALHRRADCQRHPNDLGNGVRFPRRSCLLCQFTYRAVYAALGLVLAIIVGPAFVNVMWLLP